MGTATTGRQYSIGEMKDLIAAKDADIAGVDTQRKALATAPDASWDSDFAALSSRYAAARSSAEHHITLTTIAELDVTTLVDMSDATDDYNAILIALNSSALTDTRAPGSLVDLQLRLQTAASAQGQTLPGYTVPQPDPSQDSGLAPDSWQGYATGLAWKLGLVKNPPPGTPGTSPDSKPLIPTWLKWAAGGALALVGLNAVGNIAADFKR